MQLNWIHIDNSGYSLHFKISKFNHIFKILFVLRSAFLQAPLASISRSCIKVFFFDVFKISGMFHVVFRKANSINLGTDLGHWQPNIISLYCHGKAWATCFAPQSFKISQIYLNCHSQRVTFQKLQSLYESIKKRMAKQIL